MTDGMSPGGELRQEENPNLDSDFKSALKTYREDPSVISVIDKNLHKAETDTAGKHRSAPCRLQAAGRSEQC